MALAGDYRRYEAFNPLVGFCYSSYVAGRKTVPLRSSPTPYFSEHWQGRNNFSSMYSCTGLSRLPSIRDGSAEEYAFWASHNRAYDKWRDSFRPEGADWGTALVELNKTWDMVAKRSLQVTAALTALRRGRFDKFRAILLSMPGEKTMLNQKLSKSRRAKYTKPKDAGALWLEYWMGWAPSIGDIHSGVQTVVNSDPFEKLSVGRGTGRYRFTQHAQEGERENLRVSSSTYEGTIHTRIAARVVVDNPNLYLATELGLTNPALVAWQTLPWSWLVGWAVNVEQVIKSWTDLFGVTLVDPTVTRYARLTGSSSFMSVPYPDESWATSGEGHAARRTLGAPARPALQVKLPSRLSWTRAATAISLLVQQLGRKP